MCDYWCMLGDFVLWRRKHAVIPACITSWRHWWMITSENRWYRHVVAQWKMRGKQSYECVLILEACFMNLFFIWEKEWFGMQPDYSYNWERLYENLMNEWCFYGFTWNLMNGIRRWKFCFCWEFCFMNSSAGNFT